MADKIPSELQRIVEYLNRQMSETEVLAVKIRQFEGEGRQTLVPRVIGKLAKPEPPRSRTTPWDEASFLPRLKLPDREIAHRLLRWAERQDFRIQGGRGAQYVTLYLVLDLEGRETKPLYLYEGYSAPVLHFQFDEMGAGFRGQEKRRELTDKVNQIAGANVSPEKNFPSLSFTLIREPKAEEVLMVALDWLVDELTRSRQ